MVLFFLVPNILLQILISIRPVYAVTDVTTFSVCPLPLNQYPTFVSKKAAKKKGLVC